MLGPVDYVVVGFKGNSFDGSIIKELSKAVKKNTIRVIDLLFIIKDKDGNITAGEFEDQSDDLQKAFGEVKEKDDMPILAEDDIEKIGSDMKKDTAAGVLVIEHLWAKGLKKAIIDAGGFLLADGRIHPDSVAYAVKELQTQKA
jgi:hypothetical protein